MVPRSSFVTKVRGTVRFRFNKGDGLHNQDYNMKGKITELIPDKKITYAWKNVDIPDFPDTKVTCILESIDADKTKITLINSGFGKQDPLFKKILMVGLIISRN